MQKIEYDGKSGYFYEYFRAGLTADVLVFNTCPLDSSVMLCKRSIEPFKGYFALPGGFMEENEPLKFTAARELKEETGLICQEKDLIFLDYHDFLSDPRGHSVNFFFSCPSHVFESQEAKPGDGVEEIRFIKYNDLSNFQTIPHHLRIIRKFFCG